MALHIIIDILLVMRWKKVNLVLSANLIVVQESGVLFYAFLCLWRKDFTYKFSLMIFFLNLFIFYIFTPFTVIYKLIKSYAKMPT